MSVFTIFMMVLSLSSASPSISCYDYKKDSVHVEWTGYKYSEKSAVKGVLKKVSTQINGPPQTLGEMMLATSFNVDALSVDSGNAARDTNLREYFFKLMKSTAITGKILSLKESVADVELALNGVTKVIEFKVSISESKISATGTIDLLDFSMTPSLKKINEICYELHKGKDGISKTWSTVDLNISAEPVQLCKKKG